MPKVSAAVQPVQVEIDGEYLTVTATGLYHSS